MDTLYVIVCDRWGKGNKYTIDDFPDTPKFFRIACKVANEWNSSLRDPDAYAYVSKIQYEGIRHILGSHLMTEYRIVR